MPYLSGLGMLAILVEIGCFMRNRKVKLLQVGSGLFLLLTVAMLCYIYIVVSNLNKFTAKGYVFDIASYEGEQEWQILEWISPLVVINRDISGLMYKEPLYKSDEKLIEDAIGCIPGERVLIDGKIIAVIALGKHRAKLLEDKLVDYTLGDFLVHKMGMDKSPP